MFELYDDERLDDLLAEGLKIIQSPSVFAFSLDAVLLAKFVYVPIQKGKIIDPQQDQLPKTAGTKRPHQSAFHLQLYEFYSAFPE